MPQGIADTTWVQAIPTIVVAALVLVVPGALALIVGRCRVTTAVAAGPLLSVSLITVGGAVTAQAGLSWTPATLLGWVVLSCLAALVARRLGDRKELSRDVLPTWPFVAGTVLAFALVAAVLVPASGTADAFPQHPDTVFHLSLTRWMAEQADVSTLHAAGYVSASGTGFYPAAFHGVAATVAMLTGATVVASTSATALVVGGLVWPTGVVLLAARVFGGSAPVVVGAALASVAFSAFPYWLMGYGVLWPNLLGQALIPAVLWATLGAVQGPNRRWHGLLAVAAQPGMAAAHPNATIAYGLITLAVVVWALLWSAWQGRAHVGRAALALVGALAVLAMASAAWLAVASRADSMRQSNPYGAEMSDTDALLDILLFAPRSAGYLWVGGALVVAGCLVVLVRHRRQLWVILAFAGVATLYFLNTAVDTDTTRLLTWPWYSNSPRLAALLALPGALLMAAALAFLATLVSRRAEPGTRRATAATAAVAAAYLVVSVGGATALHREVLAPFFNQAAPSAWVTDAELDSLADLGKRIPADAVVAANPFSGGSYLYLVGGHHLVYESEKVRRAGDTTLLARELDNIGDDPAVCAAARRERLTHVLTGGEPNGAGRTRAQVRAYAGFAGVDDSPSFTFVATSGPYRLYEVSRCAGAA